MTDQGKPGESRFVEELDGQSVFEIDTGEARKLIHAMDWGVRAPDKIRLMRDLVVIRPDYESGVTSGGIHVPGEVQDDQYNRNDYIKSHNQYHTGVVLAVGPGRYNEELGQRMPVGVEVGQRVRYHRASSMGLIWADGHSAVLIQGDGGEKIGDAIAWIEEDEP